MMRAFAHIGRYLPVLGIGLAALALIPSDRAKQPDGSGYQPRFAIVAPELVKQIDAALGGSQAGGEAIGAEPKAGADLAMTAASGEAKPLQVEATASAQQQLANSVAVTPSAGTMTPTGQTSVAAVGATAVNVRAGPSKQTQSLFVLQPGAAIAVAEADGDWVRVIMPGGESGWVFSRYLTGAPAPAGAADAATVTETAAPVAGVEAQDQELRTAHFGDAAVVRASPSRSAAKLFVIEAGEKVTVAETQGNWVHVITGDGTSGWVQVRDL
jgi:uncharacterized protein YgiM (DUF1202 family)